MSRVLAGVAGALALVLALAYLRDPPWLARVESGFDQWESDEHGTRYRWIGGHASFFVPADAAAITIPVRITFENVDEWPVAVSITIDDRPADHLRLTDGEWHYSKLRLPLSGSRRVRRIDVRTDRTRQGNRGVQVGEVQVSR